MNGLAELNKWIPIFNWFKEDEIKKTVALKQYLAMDSLLQLAINMIIFSLVPSFCEEVFFRGTMQPIFYRYFHNPWIAIFITAFIFSAFHMQFSGFLPRLLAGIVLGGIFYLTGNLWLSVIGHVLYNGLVVILNYVQPQNQSVSIFFETILLNPFVIVLAAIVMLFAVRHLQRDDVEL